MQKQHVQTNNVVNESCFFHSRLLFCRITHSNLRKQDSSVHQPFHRLNLHSYVDGASHLFGGPEVNNVPCSRIFYDDVQCNDVIWSYEDELIVSAFVPKICEQKFCFNAELSEKKAYEFNGFNIGGYSVIWSPLSSFGGLSVA